MPLLAEPEAAVSAVLQRGGTSTDAGRETCPGLQEAAAGAKTACVLICDITRPVPNGLLLPIVVRQLLAAGVPATGITVPRSSDGRCYTACPSPRPPPPRGLTGVAVMKWDRVSAN